MATLGHLAVGMAAGRLHAGRDASSLPLVRAMVAFSAASLAADLDVFAFSLGIPYQAAWGHRGAVHSISFGLLVGLIVWIAARLSGLRQAAGLGLLTGIVFGSHGLLDTFTDGGLGIALLWPFSAERIASPWQPLPVAPIGRSFLSRRGVHILLVEVTWFWPLLLFALWPRRGTRQSMPDSPDLDDTDDLGSHVELPIDGVLDLHTFRPRDVKELVPGYLAECRALGIRQVRIIHGKGTGMLRRTVHATLQRLPDVESFELAAGDAGGWGATVVTLKGPAP